MRAMQAVLELYASPRAVLIALETSRDRIRTGGGQALRADQPGRMYIIPQHTCLCDVSVLQEIRGMIIQIALERSQNTGMSRDGS